MKITETQLLFLLKILEGSLRFADTDYAIYIFGYDSTQRKRVYDEIVNQQYNVIEGMQ